MWSVRGHTLRGIQTGTPGGDPWIGLHGWMDNAASLLGLAQALPNHAWTLLDHAGHGLSDHRRTSYHYVDYAADLIAVLEHDNVQNCTLVGHSMGAGVALMAAAAVPERVRRVVLLEGLGPMTTEPDEAVATLRKSALEAPPEDGRAYATFHEALERRGRTLPNVAPDALVALVERGIVETEDGWRFRHDPWLRTTSTLRLTNAHVEAFLTRVSAATLVVAADEGLRYGDEIEAQRLSWLRHPPLVRLPGGHHLHMEDPHAVAQAIATWIDTTA
ncbi:MAG: alpha/beta hydrolase [bacterium]